LRIDAADCGSGFGTGGLLSPVMSACRAVAERRARHVVVYRTIQMLGGTVLQNENAPAPPLARMFETPEGEPRPAVGAMDDINDLVAAHGYSAANWLALNCRRHMELYGTTKEQLGWVALNGRRNAALNPLAVYRDPMTMADYLDARMITTPFGLYDCDVPCDGAIAVVVSAAEVAKDMPRKPVLFEAVGTQIVERTDWDQTTLTHEPQVLGQSAHLWTRTSLQPKDVDVAELYDGFTFNCLSWLEALGFCGIGEAKDFLDGGKTIARDGVIPLNTHGGQLSHGRTHGMGLIHEAVIQLRGEAGERQVKNARVAVVSSGGLTPSGAILLRTAE
jgi:acetyl-CoA acetyltransferase